MDNAKSNLPALDAEEILAGVLGWVEIESPSHDGEAVNKMVDQVENEAETMGLGIDRTPGVDGFGDILKCRTPWGGDGPGILVLSHLDTVHPVGIKETKNPIRREDDKVFGPGIYDMKAGAYIALHAMRHLIREGKQTPLPVTFMFIPEEEIGSPTSKAMIADEGKKNKYVLVTEPAREGGKIVTARNGRLQYEISVKGVPAHAGARHMDGRSAIREMAHIILKLEALTDYEKGQTCSVGIINGGTLTNVVPEDCTISVDIRIPDMDAANEVMAYVEGLEPEDKDCRITVEGGVDRPPYEKFEGIEKLFEHAKACAAEIGFELHDLKTGGGSDGNFTGALGIPTLDGLGADGHGAHSNDEFIYYSSLVERCRLMIRLMETLE
ncbi:MAG: M20 family metallopeptidase [Rhodospirillales bacterium]|nr:M20 family metallopeptidase [Rhodospirillales bacterium]MBO6785441.1 M20 family metallopeptidase [Rhodospirillales bacterium]